MSASLFTLILFVRQLGGAQMTTVAVYLICFDVMSYLVFHVYRREFLNSSNKKTIQNVKIRFLNPDKKPQ